MKFNIPKYNSHNFIRCNYEGIFLQWIQDVNNKVDFLISYRLQVELRVFKECIPDLLTLWWILNFIIALTSHTVYADDFTVRNNIKFHVHLYMKLNITVYWLWNNTLVYYI